ncbi:MAG: response regulator [Alphaproteobacteria bacterium]
MTGFENCTVLVVEDHMEIRTLLASVLTALGVRNVVVANNGAQAIEIMTQMRLRPDLAGVTEIDAIVSDWVMDNIDGATLLRWVRRHKDSPDRFMPFLMLSANADADRVELARDLGASDFLAKPFTAASLAAHLVIAMTDDRHYVKVGAYFGPDRRKRIEDVPAEKRDSQTPYTEKGVRYYPPPRSKRRKVSRDFMPAKTDLETVEMELEACTEDFRDWMEAYFRRLDEACAHCAGADPKQRVRPFNDINAISHEMRGQGGMFGYPLITDVARSLFGLTHLNKDRSDGCLKLIRNHIDTMKAIMHENVEGDGGEIGMELVAELRRANTLFLATTSVEGAVSRDFEKANR